MAPIGSTNPHLLVAADTNHPSNRWHASPWPRNVGYRLLIE
jgi:hypothetical protein